MENKKNQVWYNYFGNIRKKYDMEVSRTKPLVIFLDGKGITTGNDFNLLDFNSESFNEIMEKTVKHFTLEYSCLAIFGMDEVSFIFDNANEVIDKLNNNKNFKTNEIISVFSQYFFYYFNKLNNKNEVFWHARCHSIPEYKIKSYIEYRSNSIYNTFVTYFLKKNNVKNSGKIKLEEKIKLCNKEKSYHDIKEYEKGITYLKGERINLEEFLINNAIKTIKTIEKKEKIKYLDLKDLDKIFND